MWASAGVIGNLAPHHIDHAKLLRFSFLLRATSWMNEVQSMYELVRCRLFCFTEGSGS